MKQVEQLIKKATATVKSIDATKVQLQKAIDAYNIVVAPETTDRKSAYSKLEKAMGRPRRTGRTSPSTPTR